MAPEARPIRLIALLPGETADDAALDRYVASLRGMLGLCGLLAYRVLQQGPAQQHDPHLPVSVAGIAELAFGSVVELEEAVTAMDDAAARFVANSTGWCEWDVDEARPPLTIAGRGSQRCRREPCRASRPRSRPRS